MTQLKVIKTGQKMKTTKYYEEFKRYYKLAEDQQAKTNLGWQDYESSTRDDLMNNVQLYDVVERKLAGFSQIVNDLHRFFSFNPHFFL